MDLSVEEKSPRVVKERAVGVEGERKGLGSNRWGEQKRIYINGDDGNLVSVGKQAGNS